MIRSIQGDSCTADILLMSKPDSSHFYLTTPIYYVNARPHLGHAYSTIVCDAIARRKRALGIDTWFLTGTDEHGQKIERSAKLAGRTPMEFATAISAEFRALWDRLGLSYDDFIRTTEAAPQARRAEAVRHAARSRLHLQGHLHRPVLRVGRGLYVDGPPGTPCPNCGRITETVSEENYFFKLSAFERKLLEFYEANPGLHAARVDAARSHLVRAQRAQGSVGEPHQLSVGHSRARRREARGLRVAGRAGQLHHGSRLRLGRPEDQKRFEKFWPADMHLIGKEISRFHCVYWPAFLMAAGIAPPRSVKANGWLLFDDTKMSKSIGNIVRAETVDTVLGADALRYFLLREIPFGQDGSFSFDALVRRYNGDLANGYGNLVSRVVNMVHKYFGGVLPEAGAGNRRRGRIARSRPNGPSPNSGRPSMS